MTIRIVTDSTCDLPADLVQAYNIKVVPAYINIGSKSYLDGIDLSRQEFYKGLPTYESHPTTASPSTGTFAQVYEELVQEGATDILSIHIHSELSGISNAARLGAQSVPDAPVTLVDSQQLTMGLGLLVLTAAKALHQGMSVTEVLSLIERCKKQTHLYAVLNTLEFLRRSGRMNWAQFGLGTLLNIKPVLKVSAGTIEMKRIRTKKRANQYLLDMLEAHAPFRELSILHTDNLNAAQDFKKTAAPYCMDGITPIIAEVTPAIGAHVGPQGLGFVGITQL